MLFNVLETHIFGMVRKLRGKIRTGSVATAQSTIEEELEYKLVIKQVLEPTSVLKCPEAIDLGLSVKWATWNVGASSPSDYGNYYAWGETTTKSSYTKENSVTYSKDVGSIAGNPTYDAARANWGGTWRLPTASEIDELINKCKCKWTTQGGHNGYKITGPNGNSIFLPAAGCCGGTSLYNARVDGDYLSATPYVDYPDYEAYGFGFKCDYFGLTFCERHIGRSVRPVSE